MAGHRDDGTFAEDKAHHSNRKVNKQAFMMTGADMEYLQNRTSLKQPKKLPPCVECGAKDGEDCASNCPVND
jgi:hypothetical protein